MLTAGMGFVKIRTIAFLLSLSLSSSLVLWWITPPDYSFKGNKINSFSIALQIIAQIFRMVLCMKARIILQWCTLSVYTPSQFISHSSWFDSTLKVDLYNLNNFPIQDCSGIYPVVVASYQICQALNLINLISFCFRQSVFFSQPTRTVYLTGLLQMIFIFASSKLKGYFYF